LNSVLSEPEDSTYSLHACWFRSNVGSFVDFSFIGFIPEHVGATGRFTYLIPLVLPFGHVHQLEQVNFQQHLLKLELIQEHHILGAV